MNALDSWWRDRNPMPDFLSTSNNPEVRAQRIPRSFTRWLSIGTGSCWILQYLLAYLLLDERDVEDFTVNGHPVDLGQADRLLADDFVADLCIVLIASAAASLLLVLAERGSAWALRAFQALGVALVATDRDPYFGHGVVAPILGLLVLPLAISTIICSEAELSRIKNHARGVLFVAAGIVLVIDIPGVIVLFYPAGDALRDNANWVNSTSVPLASIAVLLMARGNRYFINEQSTTAVNQDPDPPVLYLRPFSADRNMGRTPFDSLKYYDESRATEELQVATALAPFGPFVAIGRPGEELPNLGAARVPAAGNWQETVTTLMQRARLVVLVAGSGEGIRWEIEQAAAHVPPENLIIIVLHHNDAEYDTARSVVRSLFPRFWHNDVRYRQEYEETKDAINALFPDALPDDYSRFTSLVKRSPVQTKAIIHFDPDCTPHFTALGANSMFYPGHYVEAYLVHTLRPVFERSGVYWPGRKLYVPWPVRLVRPAGRFKSARQIARAYLFLPFGLAMLIYAVHSMM